MGSAAPDCVDERARLVDLYSYEILDSGPEDAFDAIARLAAQICGTQAARVSFVDAQREWTKAAVGVDTVDIPREDSICSRTILEPAGVMVVEDTGADPRFYAGAVIRSATGRPVGTVCVLDSRARTVADDQLESLRALGDLASAQLELRLAHRARVEAHEFRNPLASVQGYAELLRDDPTLLDRALPAIARGTEQLGRLVDATVGSAR
jgi:signal transduction histidine kinase